MKTGRTYLPVAVALLLLALEACGQGAPTPPSSPPAVVAPSDTASIDVAAASAPTVAGSTLRPIRANLSVATARTALEAAGQTCDQRLAPAAEAGVVELVCRDLALDTEVRVAGTDASDLVRRVSVALSLADLAATPPDAQVLAQRSSAASAALSLLYEHPRDQDALQKQVLAAILSLSASEDDLFGGVHVRVTPPRADDPTLRVTITAT